ncbi:hypothetical protein KTC96_00885 [Clostridium estertheticum]|uniref:hypothetical protein n=1 Tax=Clostridium estertheticum TaxID=238834 RepID=UPI001C7DF542|nr:hypothetical protein [Clostridium estertheticum]MBX4261399.1 hypothetical protein [Clostridium estertheticum]WLC70634.1 hypothetical protein KTC96_00885 [Clostridium estertheticum]
MGEKDLEKPEKNRNTIEITIPFNGNISGANVGSNSSEGDTSKKKQKSDQSDDDNPKEGQMSSKADSGDFSDEDPSQKDKRSNKSEENNISVDATSKKGQMIINISEK